MVPASLKLLFTSVVIFVAASSGQALAQEAAVDPALLQKKTAEWIETRRLISEEASRWEGEKATLADLDAIRRRETEQLGEFVKAAGERVTALEEQAGKSASEKTSLQQWRSSFEAEISALEDRLKPLFPTFPSPLRDKIGDAIDRLEATETNTPLQNRARDVLLILQAAHEFQNTITVASEVRELGGEKHEVEVLYLGMTQAWFVDATGRFAGSGIPGADAWIWNADPGIAATVRKAIDVQKRAVTPDFVGLPIQNGNAKEVAP